MNCAVSSQIKGQSHDGDAIAVAVMGGSTLLSIIGAVMVPGQQLSTILLSAGALWAVSVFIGSYKQQQDLEHRKYWLKETVSNTIYMVAAISFILLCTPIGHRVGPDHVWVSATTQLAHYTTPYLVPMLLFGVFVVVLYGADKVSPESGSYGI